MSESIDPRSGGDVLGLDSGLEAYQTSPEFSGPVEHLDGHQSNDHFALIYESRAEQFAAVVPFVRQGLERDEQCLYIADENSRADVLAALRDGGVDVDAALDSGALTVLTKRDAYLRNGSFDPDEMIAFLRAAIDDAVEEYEALRVTGEATWVFDDEPSIEALLEYESKLNNMLPGQDGIALCQYNRERFPAAVLRDVVRTHPHLIYGDAVCQNFYYTPPEEFLGPEQPDREVERMLRTLVERTEAKAALQRHGRTLRDQYEIVADPDRCFEEKLTALLELGREQFGLDFGAMATVDPDADRLEVEYVSGDHEAIEPGFELPLSETYCAAAVDAGGAIGITDPAAVGLGDTHFHEEFGVETYLGTCIEIDGDADRTFFFVGSDRRSAPFTEEERTFQQLMGQWVKYELERRQRERFLQRSYEITSNPQLSFSVKLRRLLELGRERFDLDVGFLAGIDGHRFEFLETVGHNEHIATGAVTELDGTYCETVVDAGAPVDVADAPEEGWAETDAYRTYELDSYLGTPVEVDGETVGTLCFADEDARDRSFTNADLTFLELMGQWISYEFERAEREDHLAALNAMSRDLTGAETRAEIADRAVDRVRGSLGVDVAAIVDYDGAQGALSVAAETPRADDELPTAALCDTGSGAVWEAFVGGDTVVLDDVADIPGASDDVTETLVAPLGRQGAFVTASTADSGFGASERELLETAASTIEAAYTRADREQQLHEREETLEAQNETLERLNRVNDIIRSIDRALVQADCREEIERVVCEQLAGVGPYELAWTGEHDSVTGEVTPRERAGAEKGYLDDITVTAGDEPTGMGPAGRAVTEREPQVVNDILGDRSFEPWRQDALNRGFHAGVALPLVYEDTLYGVLNVYADTPGVFDGLERTVLTEMSETIAHAINAVESKKSLVSDEVTELEFEIRDESLTAMGLTSALDCALSLEHLVPRTDGKLRAYVTTRGVPAEEVLSFRTSSAVEDVTAVSEYDEGDERTCLFEVTLGRDSLCKTLLEHGGRVRSIEADGDAATVTVALAPDAVVREFVAMVRSNYPDSELVAHRTRDRARVSPTEFRATVADRLTDRQLESLQTAFFSGYFEKPRTRTGSEIAASMDISQPTFNAHVRAAQRKLFGRLFEDGGVSSVS